MSKRIRIPHNIKNFNSTYSYLRKEMQPWVKDSLKASKNKCVITNSINNLEVHHLHYNFIELVKMTFEITGIPFSRDITTYDHRQLETLKQVCLRLHYETGLGVALTRKTHIGFHERYGVYATEDDFNKFKKYIKSLYPTHN